ncbi:MAG TPA: DUF2780 domain-containing protein [Terriglobales bacterium]|nr:DUF2780 domain-containing protein [Terriglobales bacterium]
MKTQLIGIRSMTSALGLLLIGGVLVGLSQAQNPAKTTSKSPSPELIGELTKQLSITPAQATGGAGALFGLAKSRLSPADFGKVAAVVPGMNGFLKAAPSAGSSGGLPGISSLAGSLPSGASGLASTAQSFQKLGLTPDMVGKFIPVLTQFVQSKGGAGVASILSGVLGGSGK